MRASLNPELDGLTERIIGAGFAVSNGLGHGFLGSVYRNALVEELRLSGLAVQAEKAFSVHYRGKRVGVYMADIVVADQVNVESKAVAGQGNRVNNTLGAEARRSQERLSADDADLRR
jgi:GxxExxY protein